MVLTISRFLKKSIWKVSLFSFFSAKTAPDLLSGGKFPDFPLFFPRHLDFSSARLIINSAYICFF